jgi:hypothetical protein
MKYYLAILLALASFNTHAGLTKWVDSEGNVHYSDGPPPPDVKSETLRIQPPPATPAPAPAAASDSAASAVSGPKTIYEKEADRKKEKKTKEEEAQKAAQKEEEARAKQQACAQAREQLSTLQNAPRIATYNDKGEGVIMDDDTRQKRIEEAQASVSKYCQ